MLVGPKRAGKGTIARVLTALLGKDNVAGPTLGTLSSNFGLAPLIRKPLAIISDARLSGRSDQTVIVERLLSISGEDVLTIDRKHREPWTGTLPTRFLLLTNELPKLADASGARLRERGRFVQPQSSAEAIRELEDLGSPTAAFVRDCLRTGSGKSADFDELFEAWRAWCEEQGREHAGTKARFGRDLRAVLPGIAVRRKREGSKVVRLYEGVELICNGKCVA